MSVQLHGSVPVTVVYNPETRRVERVIVHDDSHEWSLASATDDADRPLDPVTADAYRAVADDAEWPSWDFGW
jgi:hypothetical protein